MGSPQGCSVPPQETFEYELLEGESVHPKTFLAMSSEANPYIEPEALKITHRIGRGPFGDVALATLHHSSDEYDEYHEVAVKMLNFISVDQMQPFLANFADTFRKCQGLKHVSWPYGMSLKNGKISLVTKLYESSVGNKMIHLKGNKLSLSDVLRYAVCIIEGVMGLHSNGILVLNLKPYNFLLDENDHAVVGDFGIPMLFLGIPLLSADLEIRLGTPNYMAPEQWEADIRGPVSYETDCWGFGCSIIEMLTGVTPWHGKSITEIYDAVVIRHEKPKVPNGLPRAVEAVINGCFEYDFRNRPSFTDILFAFQNPDAIFGDSGWICALDEIEGRTNAVLNSKWSFLKDPIQIGDYVRSKKCQTTKRASNKNIVEGKAVGMDGNMFVLVKVHGLHDPLRIHASNLEKVSLGFAAGDWVRLNKTISGPFSGQKQSSIGVLHSVSDDGKTKVAFLGRQTFWTGNCSEFQMTESFAVGQFVRIKANIASPRFQWPKRMNTWDSGKISWIFPNGCLLVCFPGRLFGIKLTMADPAEVESVQFQTCVSIVEKYQHLESLHWTIRPIIFTLGLLVIIKSGKVVSSISSKEHGSKSSSKPALLKSSQQSQDVPIGQDLQGSSTTSWHTPSVDSFWRGSSHMATR